MPTIESPTGERYDVSDQDVAQAMEAGSRVIGADELAREALQKQYGGIGSQVATAGLGLADTGSLGFGQGLALKAMEQFDPTKAQAGRELIQNLREANPGAYLGGQVAGVVAPALLSGGESLLARGGTEIGTLGAARLALEGPQALLSAGGEGLSNLVTRGLGRGLLGRAVGGIAQGAFEGGVYGGGQAFTEAEIENKPLTAELMLAGIKKGALMGGAIGGGLGLAGGVGSKLGQGLKRFVPEAEELAVKATGAKIRDYERFAARGVDQKKLGRWILDELPQFTKKPFALMTKEDMNVAASMAAKQYGEKMGLAIDDITRPNVYADNAKIVQQMRDKVLKPIQDLPFYDTIAARLKNEIDSFASHAGVGEIDGKLVNSRNVDFGQVKKFRESLDDILYESGKDMSQAPIVKEMRKLRGVLEDEIMSQGEKIGGTGWLENYKANKLGYQQAKTVEKITKKEAARGLSNRAVGLTDTIAAGAGLAALGPKGLLLAAANKGLRTYGDQIAATVVDRLFNLNAAAMMAKQTQEALQGGIRKYLTGPTVKGSAVKVMKQLSDYDAHAARVAALANSPQMLTDAVKHAGPDARHAPELHAQFATAQARAIAYLNQSLPKGYVTQSPLVQSVRSEPTKAQKNAWMRKFAIYSDPKNIVAAMGKNQLTYDDVDALKAMYPEIYSDMQKAVVTEMAQAAKSGTLPPYPKRAQLSIMMGIPVDATFDPAFIDAQQQMYAMAPEVNPESPQQNGQPLRVAQQLDTETQRIEME